jgi:hypothetical protein
VRSSDNPQAGAFLTLLRRLQLSTSRAGNDRG